MEQSEGRDATNGPSEIVQEVLPLVSCFWCARLHPAKHRLSVCPACAERLDAEDRITICEREVLAIDS